MLDRPEAGDRCLLLHLSVGHPSYPDEIEEFRALAVSAGAQIVGMDDGFQSPSPKKDLSLVGIDSGAPFGNEGQDFGCYAICGGGRFCVV